MTERAPAKINLCLLLGPTRAQDGRHELVTVFEPLELADTVTLEDAPGAGADEVVCPGVEGPNLAAEALRLFREATGWDGPPVRLVIDKRIPVAGGMAGGSADAAAALRLARRRSGLGDERLLHELAFALGADVPGQLRPCRALATGAGERLRPLPAPRPYGVLVLPSPHQLATGSVYGEADRLGLARTAAALEAACERILAGARADGGPSGALGGVPLVNDLEAAARSLCPQVGEALDAVRAAGAAHAMVSGSGPTVVGLFPTPADAERAARALADRRPAPIATRPLGT
jgi:4-diphosphocytidyl-2-C-methyl-D-erythritol kinase